MDTFITSYDNYSIWEISKNGLSDLAKFVLLENYKHHKKISKNEIVNKEEIQQIYDEEVRYFNQSKIFVAKNDQREIIGAIRVMKWNRVDELLIMKLFGIIHLNEISPDDSNTHIWHI